jgi:hypothetical protein
MRRIAILNAIMLFYICSFSQDVWLGENGFVIDFRKGYVHSEVFNFFGKLRLDGDTLVIFNQVSLMSRNCLPKKKKHIKDVPRYDRSIFFVERDDINISLIPLNSYASFIAERINRNRSSIVYSDFIKGKLSNANRPVRLRYYRSLYDEFIFDSIYVEKKHVSGGDSEIIYSLYIKKFAGNLSIVSNPTEIDIGSSFFDLNKVEADSLLSLINHSEVRKSGVVSPLRINHGLFYSISYFQGTEEIKKYGHELTLAYNQLMIVEFIEVLLKARGH